MKGIGKMIYNMGKVRKFGKMDQCTMDIMFILSNMVKDFTNGKMEQITQVTGSIMKLMGKVLKNGLMADNIKENG